ncbi:MAG: valine--tRNA ligase [Gemmataceae bacterium]
MTPSAHEPLAKQYDPKAAQSRWLDEWDRKGYFHSEPDRSKTPYTIVIPPPNVTGALHMGHALNNTLQDVLIRWRRAQGFNALWMPGTDHAGIATQAVVERLIFAQEKKTRRDIGREELNRRIWAWKDQYEKRILGQLRQLGASCDWARTRFTLDAMCTKAVRETFFKMFKDGYIFRGKRLVNWDTHLQTSVADDETYTEDTKGGFWTFKYPVNGEPDTFIRFSTTRPETMLGDTAVCVHPSDERYKHLIGKKVTIPLVNRDIPIIADGQLADPELGTGCVKVTPAHDPNDYACYTRHREIGMINILTADGKINENGGKYAGQDRYEARKSVVADMEALALFEGMEERIIPLKYSDRSKSPIEPYLSDQWFVAMDKLGQCAMDAVTDGRVKITPARYAKSYLDWLGEKRDWCISRQLWWGHQIPIWYVECPEATLQQAFGDKPYVMWRRDEAGARWLICSTEDLPREALGRDHTLMRDEDVLDTWFSSALWPHSTLGWPDQTPELKYYYPTSVLVTSRDIITLWVARMVLTGLYNCGDVPFKDVYITPKILDGFGEGMSKSKGNGVDPLDLIELYGADALRYYVVSIAGETQDSKLPVANICPHCGATVPVKQEHMYMRTKKLACPSCKKEFRPGGPWPFDDPERPTAKQGSERFEVGRNFANKLWNASRFLLMNLDGYTPGPVDIAALPVEDRWILSRLATTTKDVTAQLEGFRFNEVARTIYDFTWSEFCDWYVEMSKGRLKDTAGRATAQRVLVGVLDSLLRLIQPVMPFVTESVWDALAQIAPKRGLPEPTMAAESVCIAPWPTYPESWRDEAVELRVRRMQDLVRSVREIRNRYMVDAKTELAVTVRCSKGVASDFEALKPFIAQLAGVGSLTCGPDVAKPAQSATTVLPDFETYVSLAGLIDIGKEIQRLEKQLAEKSKFLQAMLAKLSNEAFVRGAPADIVQKQREQAADLEAQIRTLEATLKELRG